VKRYGDAANVLSSTQNSSYTLTTALKAPSVLGAQTTKVSENGLYTVILKVSSGNKPVGNAAIMLNSVSKKDQTKTKTDPNGAAQFGNLKTGIYSVIVEKDSNKVGETIINVSGPNHVLTLGINIDAQKNNPLLKDSHSFFNNLASSPFLIGGILVAGIFFGIFISKIFGRLKNI